MHHLVSCIICQSCRLVDGDAYKYLVDLVAQRHTGRTDFAMLRPKCGRSAPWPRRRRSLRCLHAHDSLAVCTMSGPGLYSCLPCPLIGRRT